MVNFVFAVGSLIFLWYTQVSDFTSRNTTRGIIVGRKLTVQVPSGGRGACRFVMKSLFLLSVFYSLKLIKSLVSQLNCLNKSASGSLMPLSLLKNKVKWFSPLCTLARL